MDNYFGKERLLFEVSSKWNLPSMLLLLKSADSECIWSAMLQTQFEITRKSELDFLFGSKNWDRIKSVLEIGFGAKNVFGSLKTFLKKPVYEELTIPTTHLFQSKATVKHVKYKLSEFLSSGKPPKFDLIILRVINSHLRQHNAFIRDLKPYLYNDGKILVIDAYDDARGWSRDLPVLSEMYQRLIDLQKQSGGPRNAGKKIHRKCSEFGYKLEEATKICIRSCDSQERGLYFRLYLLFSEVFHRNFHGKLDQYKLLNEIVGWDQESQAWAQIGLYLILLTSKHRARKLARKRKLRRRV